MARGGERASCPKTYDILAELLSVPKRDRDETVFESSRGSPLSTLRNRSADRGSRRGEPWCIYGTSGRVAVIKRAHFLPLLRPLCVSFPFCSRATRLSCSRFPSTAAVPLALSRSLFLLHSISRTLLSSLLILIRLSFSDLCLIMDSYGDLSITPSHRSRGVGSIRHRLKNYVNRPGERGLRSDMDTLGVAMILE